MFESILKIIQDKACSPEKFQELVIDICQAMAKGAEDGPNYDAWRKIQTDMIRSKYSIK